MIRITAAALIKRYLAFAFSLSLVACSGSVPAPVGNRAPLSSVISTQHVAFTLDGSIATCTGLAIPGTFNLRLEYLFTNDSFFPLHYSQEYSFHSADGNWVAHATDIGTAARYPSFTTVSTGHVQYRNQLHESFRAVVVYNVTPTQVITVSNVSQGCSP
jgi:hypothetical protein